MNYSIHTLLIVPACLYIISFIAIVTKKEIVSISSLVIGFITYTAYLFLRLFISGDFYLQGAFDSVFLTPWTISFALIILYLSHKNNTILYATIVLLICTVLVLLYPKGVLPPSPNKLSYLAYGFFLTESCGMGLFYISGCYALMYYITDKKQYFNFFYQCIILGFLSYSIAQFVGAIWCYNGWGINFRWSPRHLQSTLIWIVYINCIHLKYLPQLTQKKISVYGLLSSLLTFYFYVSSYLREYHFPRIGN